MSETVSEPATPPNSTTVHNGLIRDQVATLLVQPLEAASVVLSAGVRVMDSAAPLTIPTLTGSGSVGFVGEGEQIPDAYSADFGEITLMPTTRKSLKCIVRMTAEVVRQAHIGLDALLRQRLVHDVQTALDDALLTGDGAEDTITGLIHQPGVQTGTYDLLTPDTFLDALALLAAEEVTPTRWFLNGADFFAVRKLTDANKRYLLEADITAGTTYKLFGVPVTVTNKLPSGTALLGNMGDVVVVRDTNPQIKVLDQTYAATDEIGIRVTCRYDLGMLRPESLVKLTAA